MNRCKSVNLLFWRSLEIQSTIPLIKTFQSSDHDQSAADPDISQLEIVHCVCGTGCVDCYGKINCGCPDCVTPVKVSWILKSVIKKRKFCFYFAPTYFKKSLKMDVYIYKYASEGVNISRKKNFSDFLNPL